MFKNHKSLLLKLAAVVPAVFILATIWEFALEEIVLWQFFGIEHVDSTATRWSHISVATIYSLIALIIPVYLLIKSDISRLKFEDVLTSKVKELAFQKSALDEHAIVSITDVGGKITYVNDKFCEVSKYSREELVGQNHRIVKSGEHPPELFEELWKTISSGNVWKGEVKNTAKDGEHYWVKTTIVPCLNDKGRPFKYLSIRTNVTAQKEAELRAMASSRAKSSLLANMSHELRTPLNAIIGFSSTIQAEVFGPLNNEKYREYIGDINHSGQHLLDLINDILDVSAFEADALTLFEKEINLYEIIEKSINIIRSQADLGQVVVSSLIKPGTPKLYADERRVKQVLLNLLSNAVKFTDEGGKVIIDAVLNDDGSLSVLVKDAGYGMSDDDVAVALTKFGQVDSGHDRKHEGTGLGLPLTTGLMKLHGGTLEIDSLKGFGTTVTITFPMERVIQNTSNGSYVGINVSPS